ncbi:hypothetical protein NMG29_00285 [Streptomyces cocklensis]|jgi:hypothetical protein|nr:hypothetical protein [Actinacidiphila cocklensis]MDD1056688.1 hypothetical protein [Actinacidiphila cocklensis]
MSVRSDFSLDLQLKRVLDVAVHPDVKAVLVSGGTLKDAMVRVDRSSEKAALIHQHSPLERQRGVAAGLDERVCAERHEAAGEALSGAAVVRRLAAQGGLGADPCLGDGPGGEAEDDPSPRPRGWTRCRR